VFFSQVGLRVALRCREAVVDRLVVPWPSRCSAGPYPFSSWSGLSVRCWDPPVLEHRQASRLKNEEKHKSENHIIATDFVPPKHTSKSVSKHATEIRLKNPYLLASKYDLAKIDVNITPCYAIVCKEVLFSLEDMPPSLPPAVP
jgi:hypothetical protein